MPTIHAVLRDVTQIAALRSALNRHGWVGGRPPSAAGEREASLDWSGGGSQEFSVELAASLTPTGPTIAYGAVGWRLSDTRVSLLRTVAQGIPLAVARLGAHLVADQLIWWNATETSFSAGLSSLLLARREVPAP